MTNRILHNHNLLPLDKSCMQIRTIFILQQCMVNYHSFQIATQVITESHTLWLPLTCLYLNLACLVKQMKPTARKVSKVPQRTNPKITVIRAAGQNTALAVVAVKTWRQLVTTNGITPKKKTKRYKIVGYVVFRQHTQLKVYRECLKVLIKALLLKLINTNLF